MSLFLWMSSLQLKRRPVCKLFSKPKHFKFLSCLVMGMNSLEKWRRHNDGTASRRTQLLCHSTLHTDLGGRSAILLLMTTVYNFTLVARLLLLC